MLNFKQKLQDNFYEFINDWKRMLSGRVSSEESFLIVFATLIVIAIGVFVSIITFRFLNVIMEVIVK